MVANRIVIADDHPLFRDALEQTIVGALVDLEIMQAGSLENVISILEGPEEFDLILLDLKMPGVQGFSGLIFLRAQFPNIPVVVVSASEEAPVVRRIMELGASGFIPKSASMEDMQRAVKIILDGEIWVPENIDLDQDKPDEDADLARRMTTLTPQQMRVLMMLRDGLLNKQIAFKLEVSEATVKAHVSAILQKLNVDSRTQAVIAAAKIDRSVDV
ncbi:Transcriptional regulator, LuxR family [hydrothermal vent metagenome]|uniref:Transcriptional regulator, LuxR family n=1 Tax=hydrothermal vent metagenome TaxID=652676 RepID=A0A3B0R4E7_9ZZZZ